MIIDKIKDLYTDEEIKKESDLRSRLAKAKNNDDLKTIMDEIYTLEDEVKFRYATSCIDNKEKVINDAEEVLNALKREDFHKRNESMKQIFKKRDISEDVSNMVDSTFEDTQDHALFYILYQIRDFITICDMVSPEDSETLKAMAEEKASSWFKGEGLEVFKPSYPEVYKRGRSKIEREIFNSGKTYEELKNLEADVTPRDRKTDVPYIVNASVEIPKSLFPDDVPPFDRVVLNAVISLTVAVNRKVFSATQVAKFILYGQGGAKRPTDKQIERVKESIETLSVTKVSIDWTDHSRLNGLKNGVKHIKRNYHLPITEDIFISPNGQEVHGYRLIGDIPLSVYSEKMNHVSTIPSEALRPYGARMTETTIIIRDYLFERIEAWRAVRNKNDPKKRNMKVISMDSIIERAGLNEVTRKQKSAIIKSIRLMLNHWKEIGYIKDYRENVKGKPSDNPKGRKRQKITGYTIEL